MATVQVMEENSITASEVLEQLEQVQQRDEELSFRAGKTLDHLNHLKLVDKKNREAFYKAIEALEVPRLKPVHINKIIDMQPRNVKELGVILSGYTLTVTKEYQQKIIEALAA